MRYSSKTLIELFYNIKSEYNCFSWIYNKVLKICYGNCCYNNTNDNICNIEYYYNKYKNINDKINNV